MQNCWHIHTSTENESMTFDELLQKIHAGIISINDWVHHPSDEVWSKIFTVDEIIDSLLFEYIKNDSSYGPITGRELKSFYRTSKISNHTPVKVCGQELWHRFAMVNRSNVMKPQKKEKIELPPLEDEAINQLIDKKWQLSDILILSLTALSVATFLTCFCLYC